MDPEDIENITLNYTYSKKEFDYYRPSDFVLIPTAFITLVAIVADVLIIYVIARFKNLHTTTNIYILNWSLCNVLFLILSPINFTVLAFLEYVSREITCVWFGEILITLTGNFIFALALTFDWYTLNFCSQSLFVKIRRYYKFEIMSIWIIIVLLSFYICFHCILPIMHEWIFIVVTVSFVFMFIIQIVRLIKLKTSSVIDEKSKLTLILVSSYFLCWVPNYVLHSIKTFNDDDDVIAPELLVLCFLIGYLNPIIFILLLYYYDKKFKSSFKTLCNYSNETNELGSSFESIDIKSGQVTSLI
ncbi:7tm 1 domain containing protein [Asbolus verrucosus]|uniref:7tm 1 domain containing protein n=1 Tax=Asbolus verrucosus TaxID=1661398 RepID=A0A482VDT2_ASBVE|nr:7tm 1 domain containing protein [Asbolus verrucosus]